MRVCLCVSVVRFVCNSVMFDDLLMLIAMILIVGAISIHGVDRSMI
jgi:hypothetical protein